VPDKPVANSGDFGKGSQEYRDPRFADLDAQIPAEEERRVATMAPALAARTGKRKSTKKELPGPARALFTDALRAARELKRQHRAYYDADLKEFRTIVRKAHGRVFRLKPGPKPDARIALAARERAAGAAWQSLYPKHIDHYSQMPEFTRALAEEGFRRKVNRYLQRHRRLRRRAGRLRKN